MTETLLDLSISDLLKTRPAAAELLAAHGVHSFTDPQTLSTFGPLLKLRTLLKAQGINPGLFLDLLAEKEVGALRVEPERVSSSNVNVLALLPCPLKVPLEEAFHSFLETLPAEERGTLTYCIEGNANLQIDFADYADHFESLSEIPDIVITPGFNSFFHRPFVERFITTGHFTSVNHYDGDPQLAALGVIDPQRHYTMLAMNLLVLVVNRARLGGRPAPQSWEDLLDPRYGKSIAIRGNRDGSFCETVLLQILKDFGRAGLRQLGRNVKYGWHPSQMVKAALGGKEDAPAISAMPLFFAKNLRHRDGVDIVWPDDGALVSPVSMLVKTEKLQELHKVVSFLTGPVTARICAGAFFPALHPIVDNHLPPHATFKWIGWDYVREEDIAARVTEANDLFRSGFDEDSP